MKYVLYLVWGTLDIFIAVWIALKGNPFAVMLIFDNRWRYKDLGNSKCEFILKLKNFMKRVKGLKNFTKPVKGQTSLFEYVHVDT